LILSGNDLWISIEAAHIQTIRSVGCDTGPAVSNGDWIYASAVGEWQTFRDYTTNTGNPVNINWNIRGIVVE